MEKKCYHCNLSLTNKKYTSTIKNEIYLFCCSGCLAVFNFITASGLTDYYIDRDTPGNNITELFSNSSVAVNTFYEKKILDKFLRYTTDTADITLAIDGISCAACTWLIERHLNRNRYIHKVQINLSSCKINITWNVKKLSLNALLNEFQKIGYTAYPYNLKEQEKLYKNEYKTELKKLIISGLGMMQITMLSFALYMAEFNDINFYYWCFIRWISFVITTPILFISGKKILINAARGLKNKSFGMDFTISISLMLAYISSIQNLLYNNGYIYFDSICMFIFFLLLARFLEMRTRHHTTDIINSLQYLTVGTARIILKNNNEKYLPLEDVKIDDIILVKAGEIIPLDAVIIDGFSSVDESMITGEFNPLDKFIGNNVIGGTINIDNCIKIKVTATLKMSKLNFIIDLLEKINTTKSADLPIINVIAKYFALVVVIITLIAAFVWWYVGHDNIINIILSMLVITCPCALSLSIPTALTTSINTLSKNGFMIAKENIFEKLNNITDVVFDKTGTLTINKYFIKNIKLFRNISIKKILSLVYEIEKPSNHPIAKAFIKINPAFLYSIKFISASSIKNFITQGLSCIFYKKIYKLDNITNIKDSILFNANLNDFTIILSDNAGIIAYFNLINPLRKSSDDCIRKIKSLNLNIHVLTGDSSNKTLEVTNKLNILFSKNRCSVEDKVDYIDAIQNHGGYVMMIGDGINDVPALSQAHISIAMGSGADLAKINADAILLNNNLTNIYKALTQSKRTRKIIKQNILWAILYNLVGISIASLDLITPYYAAIGMSLSSLVVVLNSLRLSKN